MEIHTFTEEELAFAKQIVFVEYIGEPTPYQVENPIGVLLGGQPAAGKTGLIRHLRRQYYGSTLLL